MASISTQGLMGIKNLRRLSERPCRESERLAVFKSAVPHS